MQRVMKKANLPVRGARELLLEPAHLLRIHVIAVEREESGIRTLETVIAFTNHVEGLVKALIGIVMIA